jgi:hypothetical protein
MGTSREDTPLPIGVQVVGRGFTDCTTLRFAELLQQAGLSECRTPPGFGFQFLAVATQRHLQEANGKRKRIPFNGISVHTRDDSTAQHSTAHSKLCLPLLLLPLSL